MFRSIAIAVTFVATALIGSLDTAQADQVRVSARDLNLASPHDMQILQDRVKEAAEQACGPVEYTGTSASAIVDAREHHNFCVHWAVKSAIAWVEAQRTSVQDAQVAVK